MKGRWTIWKTNGATQATVDGPATDGHQVPVVPCDDAAIRRVAAALKTIPLMGVAEEPYSTAERLLRAAGETP